MLDGVSLDQLRTLIAAVDEASFSEAARRLNRVKSAVSGWVRFGGAERHHSVRQVGPFPQLTPEGVLLLADARAVVSGVDTLKARAKLMASGVEAELSVVFDVFFPTAVISEAARAFAKRFPLTPLRIFVEGLGAGYQPVLDGRCTLGILASLPMDFPSLAVDRLGAVLLVMVAARGHPLASFQGHIPKKELSKHVQLVLTDRSQLLAGRDYGVLSSTTWRLADLSTKYALLKDCVGWGGMPLHMVAKDIASGDLVALDVDGVPRAGAMLTISAVYPAAAPPGPAGRWLVEHLKDWSSEKESPEPASR